MLSVAPLLRNLASYALSLLPTYAVAATATALFLYLEFAVPPPLSTRFDPADRAIARSYTSRETVSAGQCVLLAAAVPAAAITWWCVVARDALRRRRPAPRPRVACPEWLPAAAHLYHVTCVALVAALALTGVATNALKLALANRRPDFLARCQLPARADWPADAADARGRVAAALCGAALGGADDHAVLLEGLKSTPSGHASLAAAGLGFLWWWQTQCVAVPRARHAWCLGVVALVMVSRVADHRHHWYDVVLGAALGAGVAAGVWARTMSRAAAPGVLPA
ncbi:LAFE_0G01706g1_1 [Lachancea fermentati]|uniref:LAFE_0G01706g1_1 n=1 Tax=Lachancea fermentati TaxID=4955 RepID=A0A1G4MGW3_LACFM|nr:LAFE_0G01706g1_1 [Lachancea fermentati]